MTENNHLKNFLSKAFCSKCGSSLDTAKLVPLGELPLAVVAHATCDKCKSENMITITSMGAGVMPLVSDLTANEIQKFVDAPSVSYKDVLKIHKKLQRDSICSLMHKKDKNLEKKTEN